MTGDDRFRLWSRWCHVIALAHSRQEMVLPSAGDVLTENDSILVAGPTRAIDKFEELMQKGK